METAIKRECIIVYRHIAMLKLCISIFSNNRHAKNTRTKADDNLIIVMYLCILTTNGDTSDDSHGTSIIDTL